MKTIFVLAQKSFRKTLRNKIFIVFLLFAIAIVFLSILFDLLTFTAQLKITKDVGLAGCSIFCALIAIFLSGEILIGETEKKTVYILLSKPVDRTSFILGSFLGIVWTTTVAILISVGTLFFLIYLKQHFIEPELFLVLLFIELEIIVIISIGIIFSSFCSSVLTSTLLSFFIYALGHLNPQLNLLTKVMPGKIAKGFLHFTCWILPNLEYFNVREKVVKGYSIDALYVGKILLYTFLYSTICLIIAYLLFRRREF